MFLPDRRHIHHQLVALGLSHRKVVGLLYLISCVFGVGAFSITVSNNITASLILVCVGVATVVGIRQLKYREMAILRNGILLPIYETPLWNRSLFVGFLDTGVICICFIAAYFLAPPETTGTQPFPGFRAVLPIVCGIQLTLFLLFGLYRGTARLAGVGDFLQVLKAVTLTGITGSGILLLLPATRDFAGAHFLLLDFYFLLTLVVLIRISFPVLQYLFWRNRDGDQQVLIYGAESAGLIMLQKILDTPSLHLKPVGFLDDNPQLEGKYVNGYPVYGNHWNLARLLKRFPVKQILIAEDDLKKENLARLQTTAKEYGILLKRPVFTMEDIPLEPRPPRRKLAPSLGVETPVPVS